MYEEILMTVQGLSLSTYPVVEFDELRFFFAVIVICLYFLLFQVSGRCSRYLLPILQCLAAGLVSLYDTFPCF